MSERHTIWREDKRIRATNGMGYADRVTDDDIRGHIANPSGLGGAEMIAFAEAVLAIRKYERLVAERRLRDSVGASR